jgi:serine/threonine protein kinase
MDADANTVGMGDRRTLLLAPGSCVAGKYIICDVIGVGGSAVVYAAEQLGLKRVVAFKLYPASGVVALDLLSRFEREAQLLARVHHENVVAVYDAGSMADGSPYLVVQRLHGDSLATRLAEGPLAWAEALDLARQVLAALAALSDAGITHRDVKPGNIVLDPLPGGRTLLKLVDFGIAKEKDDEASPARDAMVGTLRYMAPEQIRGENIDPRTDLYALGVTFYEMLSGRTPHTGESEQEIVEAILSAAITPLSVLCPDCPDGLAQIVMCALARDPAERFQSAREMTSALLRWQTSEQVRAASAVEACRAAREQEQTPDSESDEPTVRMRTAPERRTRTKRERALATAFCLSLLGAFALLPELVHAPQGPASLAAVVEARGLDVPLDLARAAGNVTNRLVQGTRTSLSTLLSRVEHALYGDEQRAPVPLRVGSTRVR